MKKNISIKSLALVGFGYLLSPMCWWNDLIFNLPLAYGVAKLASFFNPSLFVPCSILTYWLSNLLGIVLMQLGAVEVFNSNHSPRNWKKELSLAGFFSTAYTLIILVLLKLNFLDNSFLLSLQ